MKYRVGFRRGLVCHMGRRDSSALVGNPPRDGVSIKTPVVMQPKIHYPLMSEISCSNYEDNGVNETWALSEGLSPGRCPTLRQGGPGRYQASAKTRWNKELNVAVMECYFLSKPIDENGRLVRSYRRRMHNIWKERELPIVTEQRLCDHTRAIRKNEWFTVVEMEEIRRRLEVDSGNEQGNDSNTHLRETEVQEHGQYGQHGQNKNKFFCFHVRHLGFL